MKKIELNQLCDVPLVGECCVYMLYVGDEVIYVGQTRNFKHRINGHIVGGKKFTAFGFIICDESKMNIIEADLIVKLNPIMNVTLPRTDKYFTAAQLREELSSFIISVIHNAPMAHYREKMGGGKNHYFDIDTVNLLKGAIRSSLCNSYNEFSIECMVDNLTSVVEIGLQYHVTHNGEAVSYHESKKEAHAAEVEFIRLKVKEINGLENKNV